MIGSKPQISAARRRFLVDMARTAGGVALFAGGLGLYARQAHSLPSLAIRPPGARDEEQFLGACIRCGLCVRDCPFDTLSLATLDAAVNLGTPYFTARNIPCEMCDDIPCVKACPTGALDPGLTDIDDARMGLAVLIDQENCLNFQGLRCEVCYSVCPSIDKAITLERHHNPRSDKHAVFIPVVHSGHCTGCGKCEKACVLEKAAIKILPMYLARGELGQHYRWGWEEKQKAGRSLVTPDQQHQYNLPEGQRYDYAGEGLIYEQAGELPFNADPLETLNRGLEQQR
ncbi:MAG: ferredoxin-type protein NapG [Thiogranum sp.]|nr:ferredoxin-type protein NapG [Thiogranum sp.]